MILNQTGLDGASRTASQ